MKKIFVILIALATIVTVIGCGQKNSTNAVAEIPESRLQRVCPEKWIDNRQPCVCDQPPCSCGGQYLIVNGSRKELAEFDLEWIKANCPVNKPEVVY